MPSFGFEQLASPAVDEEFLILCDLRWDLDDTILAKMKKNGLWWIVPLGRTYSGDVVGVRLSPTTTMQSAPVQLVAMEQRNVITVSSSPATLLPSLLFANPGNDDTWSSLRKMPSEGWQQLGTLHARLGGGMEHWAAVEAIAKNDRSQKGSTDPKMGKRREEITELRAMLDPPSETFRPSVDTQNRPMKDT